MSADQPLSCKFEGDELVIRIGIDTLAFDSENNDSWFEWDYPSAGFVPLWKVVDNRGWAEDIRQELIREEEDGSTPLTNLLDKMSENALDRGSLSVWSPELGIPRPGRGPGMIHPASSLGYVAAIGQYADYYAEHDGMVEYGPGCFERLQDRIDSLPEGHPSKKMFVREMDKGE